MIISIYGKTTPNTMLIYEFGSFVWLFHFGYIRLVWEYVMLRNVMYVMVVYLVQNHD